MSGTKRCHVIAGPDLPYSFKTRPVLRYRRIPHNWVVPPKVSDRDGELAGAVKGIIPLMQLPGARHRAESRPMSPGLEQVPPGQRNVLPDYPATRFPALLREEIADERLLFAMFGFRWAKSVDQEFRPWR
jgi:hypothetical protein